MIRIDTVTALTTALTLCGCGSTGSSAGQSDASPETGLTHSDAGSAHDAAKHDDAHHIVDAHPVFDGGRPSDAAPDRGTVATCNPQLAPGPVAASCGVFVSSSMGSDSGLGTPDAPYQTLAKALSSAGGKPVYACGETFGVTTTLTLSAPVKLFGALSCAAGWKYDPTQRSAIVASSGDMSVVVKLEAGASGSSLHDFAITAADATTAGASSIAVLDVQADLTLDNIAIVAGAGGAGMDGAGQSQAVSPPSTNGGNGTDDPSCNVSQNIVAGLAGVNVCNGTDTGGGGGGAGVPALPGGSGMDGKPLAIMSGGGGSGQSLALPCVGGGAGANGVPGSPGTGARGVGSVSAAGFAATAGVPGSVGGPGQGGGGGGAAGACNGARTFSGPSGGGGGAGGCGGAPGALGTSGGSSIGILAIGATLTLATVTIATHDGGAGGRGGDRQVGAPGGQPGSGGGPSACGGGPGGQGGSGGSGGGGAGGHSIGVAIRGGAPPDLHATTVSPGARGAGGTGGDLDTSAQTKGDDGLACKTLDFGDPTSPGACTQ